MYGDQGRATDDTREFATMCRATSGKRTFVEKVKSSEQVLRFTNPESVWVRHWKRIEGDDSSDVDARSEVSSETRQ